jgi:hypothetical protein
MYYSILLKRSKPEIKNMQSFPECFFQIQQKYAAEGLKKKPFTGFFFSIEWLGYRAIPPELIQ